MSITTVRREMRLVLCEYSELMIDVMFAFKGHLDYDRANAKNVDIISVTDVLYWKPEINCILLVA